MKKATTKRWNAMAKAWRSLGDADRQALELYFGDRLATTDLPPNAAALVEMLYRGTQTS